MTQFGIDQTEAPELRSFETPKEGVARPNVFGPIANIFEAAAGISSRRKQTQADQAVAEFTKQQLLLADAYAQGRFKNNSEHVRTLMRQNLMTAIDTNPTLAANFITAQNSILGIEGGAKIVADRTDAERRERARADALISANMLPFEYTPEQFVEADRKARTLQIADENYTAVKKRIELEKSSLELDSAKRKQLDQELERASISYVREAGPAHAQQMTTTFQQILEGPGTEVEKVKAIEDMFLVWNTEAGAAVSDLPDSVRTSYLRPFEEIRDVYLRRARGEETDASTKREVDRKIAGLTAVMLQDPQLAAIISVAKHVDLGAFGVTLQLDAATAALRFINGQVGTKTSPPPYTSDISEQQGFKFSFEQALNGLQSDDPAVKEISLQAMSSILKDFSRFEPMLSENSETGIQVVRLLADPKFYKAVKENPTLLENTEGAALALETHFAQEVWGLTQREFTNRQIGLYRGQNFTGAEGEGMEYMPVGNLVEAVPVSSGVTFKPVANLTPLDQDRARREAKTLNEKLAPAINTTIKAMAHLEGNDNYQQLWESVSSDIFGAGGSDGGGGVSDNDPEDDLQLNDFQERVERAESTSEPSGSVVEAGKGYTVVRLDDGTMVRRSGTRAWRNNNPGNIEYGKFAKSRGAVGTDGRFAVFPTYEEGRAAKEALLFETSAYKNRTIFGAISRYAPSFENDTRAYANAVASAIGVSVDTPLSDLTSRQRQIMLDAMERVEGFKVGQEMVVTE